MNDDEDYLEDGPAGNSIDPLYKRRRLKLRRGLAALGMRDPFPWTGLWEWYGVWGTFGGYAGRRAHIEELAGPVRDELEAKRDATGVADWGEDNIDGIEHRLAELKGRLEGARSLDDYQDVGRRAREILIALGRLVFDEATVPAGQEVPGPSDTKTQLDIFFEQRFPGKSEPGNAPVHEVGGRPCELGALPTTRRTCTPSRWLRPPC
jgi:hypothetical protein